MKEAGWCVFSFPSKTLTTTGKTNSLKIIQCWREETIPNMYWLFPVINWILVMEEGSKLQANYSLSLIPAA